MKALSLEQEIAALHQEVAALRKQQSKAKKATHQTEDEIKQILLALFSQIKKDYHNLSPATVLFLVALGLILGCMLSKSKGGQ